MSAAEQHHRRTLLKLSTIGFVAAAAGQPAHGQSPANPGKATFNVRDFGATGDGKTLDTLAINRTLEAAAASGGGQVVFPAGIFKTFSIRLKSHVEIHLSQGCTLLAADSPKPGETTGESGGTYDAAEPKTPCDAYQDYGHNHWHNSLLWGEDLNDLSMTGPGLIWGKGLSCGRTEDTLGYNFVAEQAGVGNKAIALKNCRNVVFRDFAILKGGHFALLLTGVDNVTIDNLKIDTDRDGIDIDCCQNVRVSNCTVNSPWDDAICPKSSFALGYARPTRNVTITNCLVTGCYKLGTVLDGSFQKFGPGERAYHTGRIKCGTESNGGFQNITISNCLFEGCHGLALESVDGALLEDIAITNITMRDTSTCPLFFRLGSRLRGPRPETRVGTLRRVLVANLTCFNSSTRLASILAGIPNYPIEDLKLSNIFIDHKGGGTAAQAQLTPPENEAGYPDPDMFGPTPSHGFFLRNIRNLEMSHTEIHPQVPDARPAIALHNVHRADFLSITAPSTPSAFTFSNSTDIRILLSRAAPDRVIPPAM